MDATKLIEEAEIWSRELKFADLAAANLAANKRIEELEQERDAARAELGRLTTPRPIAEAPRDGTWVLAYWDETARKDVGRFSRYLIAQWLDGEWRDEDYDDLHPPTHFLPLPAEGGQRAEKVPS